MRLRGPTKLRLLFSLNVFLSGFGGSDPFGVAAATAPGLRTSQAERGPIPGAPSDLLELRTFGYPRTWQRSQSEGGGLGGQGYGAGRAAMAPPPPCARWGKQAAKAPGGFFCKPGAKLHHGSRELPAPAARSPRPSPARPPPVSEEQRVARRPPAWDRRAGRPPRFLRRPLGLGGNRVRLEGGGWPSAAQKLRLSFLI